MAEVQPRTLMILAILGWGIGGFFYKIANTYLHPIWVACIYTILYLCAIPVEISLFKPNHEWNPAGIAFTCLGAVFMCIGTVLYLFLAERGTASGEVASMSAVYPAITLTLAVIFIEGTFNVKRLLGLAVAVAGIWLLGKK